MHNWGFLLFAFVAVIHQTAAFTDRRLVNGRECCDRETTSLLRDNQLSTYGTNKQTAERALNYRDEARESRDERRESFRNEVREERSRIARSSGIRDREEVSRLRDTVRSTESRISSVNRIERETDGRRTVNTDSNRRDREISQERSSRISRDVRYRDNSESNRDFRVARQVRNNERAVQNNQRETFQRYSRVSRERHHSERNIRDSNRDGRHINEERLSLVSRRTERFPIFARSSESREERVILARAEIGERSSERNRNNNRESKVTRQSEQRLSTRHSPTGRTEERERRTMRVATQNQDSILSRSDSSSRARIVEQTRGGRAPSRLSRDARSSEERRNEVRRFSLERTGERRSVYERRLSEERARDRVEARQRVFDTRLMRSYVRDNAVERRSDTNRRSNDREFRSNDDARLQESFRASVSRERTVPSRETERKDTRLERRYESNSRNMQVRRVEVRRDNANKRYGFNARHVVLGKEQATERASNVRDTRMASDVTTRNEERQSSQARNTRVLTLERDSVVFQDRTNAGNAENMRLSSVFGQMSKDASVSMKWPYFFYALQGIYLCSVLLYIFGKYDISGKKMKTSSFWRPSKMIKID